jgi:hypothetical protein
MVAPGTGTGISGIDSIDPPLRQLKGPFKETEGSL